ncbi:selenocysteine-specific translation elongation factor [Sulfurospirillum multivorans]|uniref:Selenocysteine-specific translation elongation factor n=2 Tax=Sulfurospirillum multivorans TaxID=66821 RepID=A0AA86E0T3_SULMK|nr:selenocysteine-specific translation elongation factor [Sulfurospirillum multivorans]AHJ14145.1 selenocysteine-specific translation elongation factor [Sulfurospirillum multivorans DSM 12446]QEH07630.1 selenocysteine-specific translation elongation factor [Sulfurospirillum multivorans]
MEYSIVGTAGHVDHGKTALITALTGFEGDSLEEEKRRGITINLSFSSMQNEAKNVAFIDVPGHEKLLKNMISGAFGFDASLVVVDANEGIMPQTKEHLEILNLLHVKNIIVALTKKDLATPEIIEQRTYEITEHLKTLHNLHLVEIIPVSIYELSTIQTLKNALFDLPVTPKKSNGLFRYYVDRSFSIAGAGTVVTGTVLDGTIKVGEKLFAPELEKEFVIRNLQVHDHDVEAAYSSQRTAINLQNAQKTAFEKGALLCKKGFIRGFDCADVWIESIGGHTLKHNAKVILYVGTKQVEARILFYETEESIERGFAKLQFNHKLFLVHDEPFIITASGRTIGGGRVLNPINDPMKKRVKLELLKALDAKDFKSAFTLLVEMHKHGFGLISSNQRFGLNHEEAITIANEMSDVFVDEKGLVLYPISMKNELERIIQAIYAKNAYALLSANSLSLKLKWASVALVESVLQKLCDEGMLDLVNGIYKNAQIDIDNIEALIEDRLYDILLKAEFTPEAPYNIYDELDIDRKMGDDALKSLTRAKKVVRLEHNLFVTTLALSAMMAHLREIMRKENGVDIKAFKEHFDISRKYLVAYLDYLDNFDDVKKEGNRRVLG